MSRGPRAAASIVPRTFSATPPAIPPPVARAGGPSETDHQLDRERSAEHLAVLQAACRTHRLPLTAQRLVIFETLAARADHPSADQIYELVRERLPSVSRATVYRVLDTLVRIGLAVKTCTPASSVRFDPRTQRHHHLVCVQCEQVMDIHVPTLDRLVLPQSEHPGFDIQDYSVHFRGRCAKCRGRRPNNPARTTRKPRRSKIRTK